MLALGTRLAERGAGLYAGLGDRNPGHHLGTELASPTKGSIWGLSELGGYLEMAMSHARFLEFKVRRDHSTTSPALRVCLTPRSFHSPAEPARGPPTPKQEALRGP